jgi:hypothetical protein
VRKYRFILKKLHLNISTTWRNTVQLEQRSMKSVRRSKRGAKYARHIFVIVITYICNCDYIYL